MQQNSLKAVSKFPNKAALYIYGGDTCKKLGRYDEALSYWNRAPNIIFFVTV